MAFFQNFLSEISKINLSTSIAPTIQGAIFSYANQAMQGEKQRLVTQLANLQSYQERSQNHLLGNYIQKQQTALQEIEEQIQAIKNKYPDIALQEFEFDNQFIKTFASYFRNIQHLAYTLSDAPNAIKVLQTKIYVQILFQLSALEQEQQLRELTSEAIEDMLKQAIIAYEQSQDTNERAQSQQLAHMALLELIRQTSESVSVSSSVDYVRYCFFLQELTWKIPEVGASSILDNFSLYKNSQSKSILDYLLLVEKKFNIPHNREWQDQSTITTVQAIHHLLHKLRVGQDDRRAYADKRSENLVRSLFWARTIRDLGLFTQSEEIEQRFTWLAELRYLMNRTNATIPELDTSDLLRIKMNSNAIEAKKLGMALGAAQTAWKDDDHSSSNEDINRHKGKFNALLCEKLKKEMNNPAINISDDGKITMAFFYFNDNAVFIDELVSDIQVLGFGAYKNKLVDQLVPATSQQPLHLSQLPLHQVQLPQDSPPRTPRSPRTPRGTSRLQQLASPRTHYQTGAKNKSDATGSGTETKPHHWYDSENFASYVVTGDSLKEIKQNLNACSNPTQKAFYQRTLKAVEEHFLKTVASKISALHLNANDELSLRQLLELQLFYIYQQPIPRRLIKPLQYLIDGEYSILLKTPGIDRLIQEAYESIACMDPLSVADEVRSIVVKANTTKVSAEEKAQALAQFHIALAVAPDERAAAIAQVFRDELFKIKDTLKLTESDCQRMNYDIDRMAEEYVKFNDRVSQGKPALTDKEQGAYFTAVRHIAMALGKLTPPLAINDVRFKIKHSSEGVKDILCIDKAGGQHTVSIDLEQVKLPYSLIKPLDSDDFILSFGGSRGIVGLFAGLDQAFSSLPDYFKRLFSDIWLLGVGQFGTVKEIQSLVTGLNHVLKKGYVPDEDNTPTFREKARLRLETRAITAKDDPLYRIESDVLYALTKAEAAKDVNISQTARWTQEDKLRPKGLLFTKSKTPIQYYIKTPLAKGKTLVDETNLSLAYYLKKDLEFHDPLKRGIDDIVVNLKEQLKLAKAIVVETERFATIGADVDNPELGFAHNDIKPENLLYKRDIKGTYRVRFIDWATGGFKQRYTGNAQNPGEIFKEIFGSDFDCLMSESSCHDENGRRFVYQEKGQFFYGINPLLEILHGARHGTLPYINPIVLDRRDNGESLDTQFFSNDPQMDNWALMVLSFGICNRDAYLKLVKGRIVTDYAIPTLLEADGKDPLGLEIVNYNKFNHYFSCEQKDHIRSEYSLPDIEAVMYVPSNQREGEPLHLYRRIKYFRDMCEQTIQQYDFRTQEQLIKLIGQIDDVLQTAHDAVAKRQTLRKQDLLDLFGFIENCLQTYSKLIQSDHEQEAKEQTLLRVIFDLNQLDEGISLADALLVKQGGLRKITILCSYPKQEEHISQVKNILTQAFTVPGQFEDKFLNHEAPCREILKTCITDGQTELLLQFLKFVPPGERKFIELVNQEGLLHAALEQGNNDAAVAILASLKHAGATDTEIFNLIAQCYPPEKQVTSIRWSTNALHIAIRNHNRQQFHLLLDYLPTGHQYAETIYQALYACAEYSNPEFFRILCDRYTLRNPEHPITLEAMLTRMGKPSPLHLFLRDEKTNSAIPWVELFEAKELTKDHFLFATPCPLLLAAEKGNIPGLRALIALGEGALELTPNEWVALFVQTDANGKNLLNHLLEHGKFEFLTELLETIRVLAKDQAEEVLTQLIKNPYPVNPMQNFLAKTNNIDMQFNVLNQLLDALSQRLIPDSQDQQRTRLVALLVNEDWLVGQAQTRSVPLVDRDELVKLLRSSALSMPFKQYLYQSLLKKSQTNAAAHQFFQALYDEVFQDTLGDNVEHMEAFKLNIQQDIAMQKGDVIELVENFKEEMRGLNDKIHLQAAQIDVRRVELSRYRGQLGDLKNLNLARAVELTQRENNIKRLTLQVDQLSHEIHRQLGVTEEATRNFLEKAKSLGMAESEINKLQSELSTVSKKAHEETDSLMQQHANEINQLRLNTQEIKNQPLFALQALAKKAEKVLVNNESALNSSALNDLIYQMQGQADGLILLIQADNPVDFWTHINTSLKRQQLLIENKIQHHIDIVHEKLAQVNQRYQQHPDNKCDGDKYQSLQTLHQSINVYRLQYLQDGDLKRFAENSQKAITKAKPALSEHSNWLTQFSNILLSVLSAGLINITLRATVGRWTLFQADGASKVGQFDRDIKQLLTNNP